MVNTERVFPSGGYVGLTKRELFAALAMQAGRTAEPNTDAEKIASWAVADADALIAALKGESRG